jgi:SAM-dependent methyltransferase
MDMDWSEVTGRVVVAAIEAHPLDQVVDLGCGTGELLRTLAPSIRTGVGVDRDGAALEAARQGAPENLRFVHADIRNFPLPTGTSVVLLHDSLRYLSPLEQQQLLIRLGRTLPERGLLVIGDVVWSWPRAELDEPEQYGPTQEAAPAASTLETMVRTAGFLPDLHRFGPGRAVMIALRASTLPIG